MAAACAAALVLPAACGGDGGAALSGARSQGDGPPTLAGPATTTTAPPSVVSAGLPTTTARAGTAPAGTTATTATAARPAPTTTIPALTPAVPGTYRYDTSGQSAVGALVTPFPAMTTLVVDAAAGTTQHSTRSLRDPAGNGPVLESTFDYRSDGVYLVGFRLTATVLLITQTADIRPPSPVLFLPKDAAPGYHRDLDVGNAHLVLDVVRSERLTIGGTGTDTLLVHLAGTLTGQINGKVDLTVSLAPANRVWVKEHFVADATTPDGSISYHAESDSTLQRLTPS